MNSSKISRYFATLGPIGYLPAPGTCASFVTAVLVYLLPKFSLAISLLGLLLLTLLAVPIIVRALSEFSAEDPSEIVFDEVVSMAWVLVGIPKTVPAFVVGFLIFRFFDITKWAGVSYFDQLPGWKGVLFDDLFAAALSYLCMQVLLWLLLI